MRILEEKGVEVSLDSDRLFIDSLKKRDEHLASFITHAHSDHVSLNGENIFFSTPQTKALLAHKSFNENVSTLDLNKKKRFGGFEVTLYNAGHVLGSSQIQIANGINLVVTGDIRTKDSLLFKGAEPIRCDTLIVESTFGRKEFCFPKQEDVLLEMQQWCKNQLNHGKRLILAGYKLGKAQELTKFCNEYLNVNPLVHRNVYEINKVYEKQGFKLGGYELLDSNLNDSDILIIPPASLTQEVLAAMQFSSNKKITSMMATGWNYHTNFNKLFPYSDHADFDQLIDFVKATEAKKVYTYHGFAYDFARSLQKHGIDAKPLSQIAQKNLYEF